MTNVVHLCIVLFHLHAAKYSACTLQLDFLPSCESTLHIFSSVEEHVLCVCVCVLFFPFSFSTWFFFRPPSGFFTLTNVSDETLQTSEGNRIHVYHVYVTSVVFMWKNIPWRNETNGKLAAAKAIWFAMMDQHTYRAEREGLNEKWLRPNNLTKTNERKKGEYTSVITQEIWLRITRKKCPVLCKTCTGQNWSNPLKFFD